MRITGQRQAPALHPVCGSGASQCEAPPYRLKFPPQRFKFAPYGKVGLKAAILDVGTQGKLFWFDSAGNSNIARSFSYMIHLWRCAGTQYS